MKRFFILTAITLIAALLFPRCAKVVSPTGGEKDTLAPVMLHSTPALNATNFKGNKLSFVFDEFIQLKDHQRKMLVSPPLKYPAIVSLKGKKVVVEFSDTLTENTTYTLYMGDAIEDNNERNPIPNFEFAFSTGATIDSLFTQGKITDAFTNKPVEGALVMLYSTFEDSLPYNTSPMHVAKTREDGTFKVNNLKKIDYKVVAIVDANGDYRYNQGAESIGFISNSHSKNNLSSSSDTLKSEKINIKLFREELASQIITGSDRENRKYFNLYFSRPPIGKVEINPLNFKGHDNWYIIEGDNNGDTLKYWLIDTTIHRIDTMRLAINYLKSDSLNQLHQSIDTLTIAYFGNEEEIKTSGQNNEDDKPRGGNRIGSRIGKKKTSDDNSQKPVNPMKFSIENKGQAKSGFPLTFTLPFPAKQVNPEGIMIFNATDSIMEPQVSLVADKNCPVKYSFTRDWKTNVIYKMIVLPSTFITYDAKPIDSLKIQFTGADPENYGIINIKINGFKHGVVVELLTDKDKFIDRIASKGNGTVSFKYLKPAKYKLRIIDDNNSNGQWDAGNYLKGIQPENVFIYKDSKKKEELNVRAYWETEVEFTKPSKK